MLAQLFRKLLLRPHPDSLDRNLWWARAYDQADPAARFGPAERNELGSLIDALQLRLGHPGADSVPLSYTTLHGYVCGIVVGPPNLPCSIWLARLMPFPEESTHHHMRLLTLMRCMAAHLEQDFQRPKPHMRLPALGVSQGPATKVPGPPLLTLGAWCFAFLQAVALQPSKWAKFGKPDARDGNLLEPFWHYGTVEGQQHWEETRYNFYRGDGHGSDRARQLVIRDMLSSHTPKSNLATVRLSLKWFWAYWRGGIDVFKMAEWGLRP